MSVNRTFKLNQPGGVVGLDTSGAINTSAPIAISAGYAPTSLAFGTVNVQRPFSLLSRRQYYKDWPSKIEEYDVLSYNNGGIPASPTVSFTNGGIRLSNSSGFAGRVMRTKSGPIAPWGACRLKVHAMSGGSNNIVCCGLVKDTSNWLVAKYDAATQTIAIEQNVAGTIANVNNFSIGSIDLGTDFGLVFVIAENEASLFTETTAGGTVRRITTPILSGFGDLTLESKLTGYKWGIVTLENGATTADLTSFEAGYTGCSGVIGGPLVTYSDGAPYRKDGKVFLLLDNQHVSSQSAFDPIRVTHQAVYSLDESTCELAETGKFFFRRSAHIYGDNNLKLVLDPTGQFFWGLVATWGTITNTGTVRAYIGKVRVDALRDVTVYDFAQLTMPTANAAYDFDAVYIAPYWYVTYCSTSTDSIAGWNFYATCARFNADFTGGTLVWQDTAHTGREGTRIFRCNGTHYALAAANDGNVYVYDLLTGTQLGTLNIDAITPGLPPHHTTWGRPMPDGTTEYMAQTFDAANYDSLQWSAGNLYVRRASQRATGWEYPPRISPIGK